MRSKGLWFAAGFVASFVSASALAADLVFTAPPRGGGKDEGEIYRPVAEYLSAAIGRKVVYQHSDNWLTYQDKMRKDAYDIYFDGPAFMSWRMAKQGHEPLVKLPGQLKFVVIARNDNSKVNNVKDLMGRSVCGMAPPNLATLTLYSLFDNPSRQPVVLEVESFKEVFHRVTNRQCVGGAMGAGFYKQYNTDNQVKVLWQSEGIPNQGFTAGIRVTPQEKLKIIEAMLTPEARTRMANFFEVYSKDKGLVHASPDEYQNVAVLLKDTFGYELARADER